MDIIWAVLAFGSLTLLFVIVGGLLRVYLGRLPGWFYLGGLAVCTLILVWAAIWNAQHPYAELDGIPALVASVNAVIAAVALVVGWVVQRLRHAYGTRAPGSVNTVHSR